MASSFGSRIRKVDDNVFRGPAPKCHEDLAVLKQLGVTHILSLETGWFEWFHGRGNYEVSAALCYFAIPVIQIKFSNILPPSGLSLQAALIILLGAEQSKRKVYVHCLHGKDRTGFLVALYRVLRHLWAETKAIAEMHEVGFHRFSYFWWTPFLLASMGSGKLRKVLGL